MPKTVTASEAKSRLGAIMAWAEEHEDEVIVQSRGQPRAVIMSFAAYEQYARIKEQLERRQLLAQLEQLAQSVRGRNVDLSAGQAGALANRFVREVIEEMAAEGQISFHEP